MAPIDRWAWLAALREPGRARAWALADWERVVRLARRLRLLARLAETLDSEGGLDGLPDQVVQALRAEQQFSRWQTQALRWTAERAAAALDGADYPRVLLKGAAYLAQELPIGRGRLPSDLDLLVPRAAIRDAQRRLAAAGWQEVPLDAHDHRYYHDWSHEVPPLRHPRHLMELDLHHSILPPLARLRVDASLLLAEARPSRWPGWHVLHPRDQILHSAAHLVQDPELTDRVRDLVDLDQLLRQLAPDAADPSSAEDAWQALVERARELGLGMPLDLVVALLTHRLQTPVPPMARRQLHAIGAGALQRAWLLPALEQALTPLEPDGHPSWPQRLAGPLLLARYHVTRLPPRLLLLHVWHKLRTRRAPSAATADAALQPLPVRADAVGETRE
jgi:hypothetical protein